MSAAESNRWLAICGTHALYSGTTCAIHWHLPHNTHQIAPCYNVSTCPFLLWAGLVEWSHLLHTTMEYHRTALLGAPWHTTILYIRSISAVFSLYWNYVPSTSCPTCSTDFKTSSVCLHTLGQYRGGHYYSLLPSVILPPCSLSTCSSTFLSPLWLFPFFHKFYPGLLLPISGTEPSPILDSDLEVVPSKM